MSAVQWWADHARAAAADRLRSGRPIDREFVAGLDADCAAIVAQVGGDLETALFALHAGLYSAHATDRATSNPRPEATSATQGGSSPRGRLFGSPAPSRGRWRAAS